MDVRSRNLYEPTPKMEVFRNSMHSNFTFVSRRTFRSLFEYSKCAKIAKKSLDGGILTKHWNGIHCTHVCPYCDSITVIEKNKIIDYNLDFKIIFLITNYFTKLLW